MDNLHEKPQTYNIGVGQDFSTIPGDIPDEMLINLVNHIMYRLKDRERDNISTGAAQKESIVSMGSDLTEIIDGWYLSDEGNLVGITWSGHPYTILKERLSDPDWIDHMATKAWVDMAAFIPAYFVACARLALRPLP